MSGVKGSRTREESDAIIAEAQRKWDEVEASVASPTRQVELLGKVTINPGDRGEGRWQKSPSEDPTL